MYEASYYHSCAAVCGARDCGLGRGYLRHASGISGTEDFEGLGGRRGGRGGAGGEEECYNTPVVSYTISFLHLQAQENPVNPNKHRELILLGKKSRHLLTHTSGLAYETMFMLLDRSQRSDSAPIDFKLVTDMVTPLLFEPGTGWRYGTSMDWAGKLVERLTGQTLEEYMSTNIWGKLGITDITFWPKLKPGMAERTAGMSIRDGQTGALTHEMESIKSTAGARDCFGGHGAYASMPSFMKILQSLLRDDGVLLKRETTGMMFEPQLTEVSREALRVMWEGEPETMLFIGEFEPQVRKDWGLGGMLVRDGTEGWRRRSTLVWSGLPNLFWVGVIKTTSPLMMFGELIFWE